jgi:hypothetical protein
MKKASHRGSLFSFVRNRPPSRAKACERGGQFQVQGQLAIGNRQTAM